MNVFSILAAFGVVSYVFDHEWTARLIGWRDPYLSSLTCR